MEKERKKEQFQNRLDMQMKSDMPTRALVLDSVCFQRFSGAFKQQFFSAKWKCQKLYRFLLVLLMMRLVWVGICK